MTQTSIQISQEQLEFVRKNYINLSRFVRIQLDELIEERKMK
jgi:hypothetical protein